MRIAPARLILAGALGLAGCASGPGPAAPPEGTASASAVVVAPVAPEPSATATEAAADPQPAAPAGTGCFAKPVTVTLPKGQKLAPLDPALPGKLAACDREIELQACRYKVARAYFEAGHYEDAGPLFREAALSAGPDPGIHAAQLYLECLNIVGGQSEPGRPVCYDEMANDIGPLQARHCGKVTKDTMEACTLMRRIDRDIQRMHAEGLVTVADRDPNSAPALYRQAGDAYMSMFNRYCAFRRPDVKHKPVPPPDQSESHCEEIAYNAMRAYMAAKEPKLAEAARAALLNPDNQLHKTELAKKAAALPIQ